MDPTTIAPELRIQLVTAGQDFSSELTLAQANKTLKGLETHGPKLVAFGFGLDEGQDLQDVSNLVVTAGVGRQGKRTNKKQMSVACERAVKEGQQVRLRARSILTGGRRVLARSAAPEAVAAVQLIDIVLNTCSVATDSPSPLAGQLDELLRGLANPAVTTAVAEKGGPQAVIDLTARAAALRAADQATAGARGTPEHTEYLDLLDGIILELVRGARDAADVASKELGEPALLSAFALTELYPNAGTRAAPEPAPVPVPKATAPEATAIEAAAPKASAPEAPAAKASAPEAPASAR